MPRARRIDAPGLFHHVVVRGIERRLIFVDDEDRMDFLRRLERVLPESGMPCLAWALIPNHVHLLVRTAGVSVSRVMARIGTGYARRFNERHRRVGHLFQNRFLSRPIEDDGDLLGVIRYVHLNPVRHGLVPDVSALEEYPWCGAGALCGRLAPLGFHDVDSALHVFGSSREAARERWGQCLRDGAAGATGEGARLRAASLARPGPGPAPDPTADQPMAGLIAAISWSLGVAPRELIGGGKTRTIVRARALVAHAAAVEQGIPVARIAEALGISEATTRRAIEGERRRRATRAEA